MLQKWRAVGNTGSNLTGQRFVPHTHSRNEHVIARPTARSNKIETSGNSMKHLSKTLQINNKKIAGYIQIMY